MELTNALKEKEQRAIEFLRAMERPEGYHLSFSGGKDSCVVKHLAEKAGVKFEAVYRVTSVDPPELVRFIKEYHPDVRREIPHDKDGKPITMWSLIRKHRGLPTRLQRWCCQYLKEDAGDGRMTITGVRWAESTNRSKNQGQVTIFGKGKAMQELADQDGFQQTPRGGVILVNDNEESRRMIESCYKRHKTLVNPIIDWTDKDVWEYIRAENIPYCSLYDEGWERLGCIGCPMARYAGRTREFNRWPKYEQAYKRALSRVFEDRCQIGRPFKQATVEETWAWWMEDPNCVGQMTIFDEMEGEEDDPT